MSATSQEFLEVFLQEASEHLQYLREYSIILQDPYPDAQELERLYVAAHTLAGASSMYGFHQFSEVAAKLAHIFQYTINAGIAQDAAAPLLEFLLEGIAVLECDLLMISGSGDEAHDDVAAFREKYPFAFPQAQPVAQEEARAEQAEEVQPFPEPPIADLPVDGDVSAEVLEFFVPEVEEHLQAVTDCLLALEAAANPEDVHRLFRAVHTIKGSAAQVGLARISRVAHRLEDLIGRLRDGELQPSAEIVDVCLEAADALKRSLYRQWDDETSQQMALKALLARIGRLAPEQGDEAPAEHPYVVPEPDTVAAETYQHEYVAPTEEVVPEIAPEVEDIPAPVAEAAEAPAEHEVALATKRDGTAVAPSKSVRIALERLDRMMNAVGELVINRTRMLGRLGELQTLTDVLNFSKARLSDKISEFQEKHEFSRLTMRPSAEEWLPESQRPNFGRRTADRSPFPSTWYGGAAHDPEFSELEMDRYDDFNILSRSLTEISADITEVLTQLDGFVRRVDGDIDEFTKLAHRLQDEITAARMVPIGNLYTRIARTVRDAAKAAGKQIELTLAGAETELDNNIIQQVSDPLLHLVRNAVAHGIERPDERYGTGKPDQGHVAVRAYHRGNHIYIEVEDDGRGVDYERVRATAVETGVCSAEEAHQLTEDDLLGLLFKPGFSTAPRKTELAGRGVGLDVVRANLTALNAEVDVETQKGLGTRFTLKVPLTLIISQALFVRCGKDVYAMPLAFVEEIRRLRAGEIEEVGGKLLTKVRDVVTEIVRLDAQLGLPEIQPVNGCFRLVIVNVAGRQVGIVVEEVLRKDEVVVKNLGEYLRNVKMFPGATIAPDGSLILMIDVNRLVAGESIEHRPLMTAATAARIFAPGAVAVASGAIPEEAIEPVAPDKLIVLADDSISVRKFVGRMLEKAGYRVLLAGDGLEALEIASQASCDLVITDLEMPRTNGYELIAHLRQNPETRTVPVMVVTSRAGEKHRERALREGASSFLIKPVQEEQLVTAVEKLIGTARPKRIAALAGARA